MMSPPFSFNKCTTTKTLQNWIKFSIPKTNVNMPYLIQVTANFTPDVTPLVLAAQRNNYEILKMLLDRGATIPMPHDVKCSCEECVDSSSDDSLRFSLARINSYKVLHIFIAPIHIEFIELNCKETKFMYTQLCRLCQCCF